MGVTHFISGDLGVWRLGTPPGELVPGSPGLWGVGGGGGRGRERVTRPKEGLLVPRAFFKRTSRLPSPPAGKGQSAI